MSEELTWLPAWRIRELIGTGDVSPEYLNSVEMGRRDGESNPETRLSSYQLDLGLSRID